MAEARTGAELFLRTLNERGVRFLFLNPGTETFPVQEAYAKLQTQGEPLPQLLLCPFENLASTAAQGAFLGLGSAQAALVHVDVGTANAAGTLNDAKANRTPVLLCAGRSPVSQEAVPGGRSKFINWLQDVPDQAALVRNYIKNEQIAYQPEAVPRVINRALQVAESAPAGPVYVSFPRESMMARTDAYPELDSRRFSAVHPGAASTDDVETLADWILSAHYPMVITGYLGRDISTPKALEELSDLAGLGVVEYRGRVNFPLTHPHHQGFRPETATEQADLIIVLEHDVPYVPNETRPPDETKLVHIGTDPYFETIQSWGFPSDLGIRATPLTVMQQLLLALRERLTPAAERRIADRKKQLSLQHAEWTREAWQRVEARPGEPVTATLAGQIIDEMLPSHSVIFEEAVTSANPVALQLRDLQPGTFFRNGGTYLGWALGAAIGYGLARPEAIPVALVGDGSFLFSVPSSALWFARQHAVPLLTIVLNNSSYNSVRLAARDAYPDGWQVKHGYVGTDMEDGPRPDLIAQACGIGGFSAQDGDEFRTELAHALKEVHQGRPAVVSVNTTLSARAT
jgi:acetolactate synthase I/II/III large subunit